ncbi:MAG: hypothetical protein JO111_14325 [Caulobacteraceae bacterium]|nr:hypothetical protein [Caulobacteraceae bacterium]
MALLRVLAVVAGLVAILFVTGVVRPPEGGQYPRYEHDHDEVMVSKTPHAARTVTVALVGNSITFHNDLAAMLVNLASSDPGNTTRLQVKGLTYPNATLDELRMQRGALSWIQSHHVDYAVLQEHSIWYDFPHSYDALGAFTAWDEALRPQGVTPLLFEDWADGDGSGVYTDDKDPTFGSNSEKDAANSANATAALAKSLGLQVVSVGDAFEAARETSGAPDVWGPDHHHASVAGTYLAAVVFYHFLTGRTAAEATYRPSGLSARDAATLIRLAGY